MLYDNGSIFVLKLILYPVRFKERKMDHEKSYTNHHYINKIGYTCSSLLFYEGSIWFNIFSIKVTQEKSKEIRFSALTNPILFYHYQPTKI